MCAQWTVAFSRIEGNHSETPFRERLGRAAFVPDGKESHARVTELVAEPSFSAAWKSFGTTTTQRAEQIAHPQHVTHPPRNRRRVLDVALGRTAIGTPTQRRTCAP